MNNNTWGTYIWLGVMALLILALRTADGGFSGLIEQADTLFLAATASATATTASAGGVPSVPYIPMLVIGGLLALAWAMFRQSSDGGSENPRAARKYLAIQYRLLAKDLDND